jgi:hypothetical protein
MLDESTKERRSVRRSYGWMVLVFLAGATGTAACAAPVDTPSSVVDPAKDLEAALRDHLRTANALGPTAAASYTASVDRLRERASAVITLAETLYQKAPVEQFEYRWSLLNVMGEMRSASAVRPLHDALAQPFQAARPELLSEHGPELDRVRNELKVRMAALRGLRDLSQSGNAAASQSLEDLVRSHDAETIRREAAIALVLSRGGDVETMSRLRAILPASQQWILSVERDTPDKRPRARPQITERPRPRQTPPPVKP